MTSWTGTVHHHPRADSRCPHPALTAIPGRTPAAPTTPTAIPAEAGISRRGSQLEV
ncbi:MAG: hypothetical protein KIT69_14360 [Propionibacteriaceae bacterium]|nr:hypothetical protein [Propionibacteriaceae bacterium]